MSRDLNFPMHPPSAGGRVSEREFSGMGGRSHSEPPPLLSEVGEWNIQQNGQDDWHSTQVQNGSGLSDVHLGEDPGFGETK
jgi:hypothetical protein